MPYVELREGESGEALLRRFNTSITKAGILRELKDRRFFQSNQEKARIAAQRAARRRRRQRPVRD